MPGSGVFLFKAFAPKALAINEVRGKILSTLQKVARDARLTLEPTVDNWSSAPRFRGTFRYAGGDASVAVVPVGDEFAVKKWGWLDRGTRVRYAALSRDWQSKTRPNSYFSSPGSGTVIARGRRAGAHRGIQARNWSKMATTALAKKFPGQIQGAINAGIAKSNLNRI